MAYSEGYWNGPRKTTGGDIATAVGINKNTTSEHLRQGAKKAVGENDLLTQTPPVAC